MIDLMPTRYRQLEATLQGLHETGVPLVRAVDGTYIASGTNDDPGLYLIAPWIARTFGLSAQAAADVFFIALLVIAALSGLIGLWVWSRKTSTRTYGTLVILAMAFAAFRIGDVYLVAFCVPVAFVPWLLHAARERTVTRGLFATLVALGVLGGCANLVRGHSATAVMIFAAVLALSCTGSSVARRTVAIAVLVAGLLIVSLGFSQIEHARDSFLAEQPGGDSADRLGHPFWHTAYIGLGYIDNEFVPDYRDQVGYEKAAESNPEVRMFSAEYEMLLREEYFRLLTEEPAFIARVYATKAAVHFRDFLVFMNLGLIALVFKRPPRYLLLAFVLAIALETLPGLVAIPRRDYILGFYTFTALFAVVSVDYAWDAARAFAKRSRVSEPETRHRRVRNSRAEYHRRPPAERVLPDIS